MDGNLIVEAGRLVSVIDWGGLTTGDPAVELMIAWSLFDPESRATYRAALGGVDDAMWLRGRAWATSAALQAIPYYRDTNPDIVARSWRAVRAILADVTRSATAGSPSWAAAKPHPDQSNWRRTSTPRWETVRRRAAERRGAGACLVRKLHPALSVDLPPVASRGRGCRMSVASSAVLCSVDASVKGQREPYGAGRWDDNSWANSRNRRDRYEPTIETSSCWRPPVVVTRRTHHCFDGLPLTSSPA